MGREGTKGEGGGGEGIVLWSANKKRKVGAYAVSGPKLRVNFRENFRRGQTITFKDALCTQRGQ